MNRIVAYEIEIRYKRAELIVQKRPVTKILQRISISCPTRVCPDASIAISASGQMRVKRVAVSAPLEQPLQQLRFR